MTPAPRVRLRPPAPFAPVTAAWPPASSTTLSSAAPADGSHPLEHYGALLVNTREMAAELIYYLRDTDVPLYVWARGPAPHNHYEMTRRFGPRTPEPILFVSFKPCPEGITQAFGAVNSFPPAHVPLVKDESRTVYTCRLAGFKGMEE